jgi:uncharacterized protein
MIVADTCAWIEVLVGSELGRQFTPYLQDHRNLIVPTLVQAELRKWALRERGENYADLVIAATRAAALIEPLTENIALAAADHCIKEGLAIADAVIYATAQFHNAELITSDAHFVSLPNVKYLEKKDAKGKAIRK